MSNLREFDQNPFWMAMKSNYSGGESIDSLLKSSTLVVESLVEHESFVSEWKSNNIKLLEFLWKKKNLKQLLELIIEEPPEGWSHTRGHKLPFVVSEVLSSENPTLLDALFRADGPDEVESEEIDTESYQTKSKDSTFDDVSDDNGLSNETRKDEFESELSITSKNESRNSRQTDEDENNQTGEEIGKSDEKAENEEANRHTSENEKTIDSEDTKLENDQPVQNDEENKEITTHTSSESEGLQEHTDSGLSANKQEEEWEDTKQNNDPVVVESAVAKDENLSAPSGQVAEKLEFGDKQEEKENIPLPDSSEHASSSLKVKNSESNTWSVPTEPQLAESSVNGEVRPESSSTESIHEVSLLL